MSLWRKFLFKPKFDIGRWSHNRPATRNRKLLYFANITLTQNLIYLGFNVFPIAPIILFDIWCSYQYLSNDIRQRLRMEEVQRNTSNAAWNWKIELKFIFIYIYLPIFFIHFFPYFYLEALDFMLTYTFVSFYAQIPALS